MEQQQMISVPKPADEEMLIIECCRSEVSHCPNVLTKTGRIKEAVEAWARENRIQERLRERFYESRVLFHHKFRISVSGCPNACSRPQIADVGIVGYVQPQSKPEGCIACGACLRVCPDEAITLKDNLPVFDRAICQGCNFCRDACPNNCITLSHPKLRLLLGGKLGRHPHLGYSAMESENLGDILSLVKEVIGNYLNQAKTRERFADFIIRTKGKECYEQH